jgi:hypothetical protein
VADWSSEFDMPHALATNDRAGYFDSTFVAHNPLVADTLVLTTVALPILGRSKDLLAEQAFWLVALSTVVYGLWLGDLAVRPATDIIWAGYGEAYAFEVTDIESRWLLFHRYILRFIREYFLL